MDERVADRIRERLAEVPQEPTALVFGSSAFPDRVWDVSNRQKTAKALYREIADALDAPLLRGGGCRRTSGARRSTPSGCSGASRTR